MNHVNVWPNPPSLLGFPFIWLLLDAIDANGQVRTVWEDA